MKIVIIGARGMLGSALAAMFADLKPTLWDKEVLDITQPEHVAKQLGELKPTHIINAAAYTNVDEAEREKELAFAVNASGARNVAQAAKNIGATLVYYSTDYVFPGTNPEGYAEDMPAGPAVNVYGESKLAGEQALHEIQPIYYVLRTAWLYGPDGKNFVDTMRALAGKQSEVAVVNDQHGSPTFTYDVARATRELLEGHSPAGIYHTVNQGSVTWSEFAQKIFATLGLAVTVRPVPSSEFPRPAKRPKYSMLVTTRGPRLRSWEAALDDYLKNYTVSPS